MLNKRLHKSTFGTFKVVVVVVVVAPSSMYYRSYKGGKCIHGQKLTLLASCEQTCNCMDAKQWVSAKY